jgi:hypothetical protein
MAKSVGGRGTKDPKIDFLNIKQGTKKLFDLQSTLLKSERQAHGVCRNFSKRRCLILAHGVCRQKIPTSKSQKPRCPLGESH